MLTHLLGKQGFAARLISYENVSRDRTNSLDVSEATMACISYHDFRGSSARLRYHIQRLKQRLPTGTPILVGIRPSEDTVLSNVACRNPSAPTLHLSARPVGDILGPRRSEG